MSSEPNQTPILASDLHVEESSCHVTVVGSDRLAHAAVKKTKAGEVQQAIDSESDVFDLLEMNTSWPNKVEFVVLKDLEAIEWHEDDADAVFQHYNHEKKKSVRTSVKLRDADSRSGIISAVQQAAGVPFETTEEKSSIWRLGQGFVLWGSITSLVFLCLGINGLMTGQETYEANFTGRRRAIKRLLVEFYNNVGPTGMCWIGAGLLAASLGWWIIKCRNPPSKIIATATKSA
jgi:hypothetical protein